MEDVSFLYAELQRYKKNPAVFYDGEKERLSRRTETFLNEYLADEVIFETDAAPELLMLLQKAAVFDSLHDKIKQARKKLQQQLNDFDERYSLSGLESLSPELIEKNVDKISILAQMPLKDRPAFKHMFDIISQIDLTDENGNSVGGNGRDRIEATVTELAKTDAFFCLLGAKDLTVDEYFSVLHDAMQINLIGLFYTEEIARHYPLSEEMKEKAAVYMEKLTGLIK
ncbi:MAG: hypothetical protein ACI4TE_05830 [Alphaproteobacteria bacterium]